MYIFAGFAGVCSSWSLNILYFLSNLLAKWRLFLIWINYAVVNISSVSAYRAVSTVVGRTAFLLLFFFKCLKH